MQIKLKVGGRLREFLPAGSSGSQANLDVTDGATVIDVMNQLGLPGEDSYLVMLNGTVLPAAKRPKTVLQMDDDLGVFPPLKSG